MVRPYRSLAIAGVFLVGALASAGCSHQNDMTTPGGVTLPTGQPQVPAPKNATQAAQQAQQHAAQQAAQYEQQHPGAEVHTGQ